jgi:aldose 1-epimerase
VAADDGRPRHPDLQLQGRPLIAPTGTQYELTLGDQRAVVTEVGATLRTYDVGGQPVADGFDRDARPDGGRGQVLAPWPNRIRDGRWTAHGDPQQLALTEVAKHNAIHGLVRWVGWSLVGHAPDRVDLRTTVWPQPGYPFRLGLTASYELGDLGLTVSVRATNEGDRPAPYGVGHHPYVTLGGRVDDAELTLPARCRLVVDDRGIPTGRADVAGTPYDFRSPRLIGDLALDTCYSDLERDADGRVTVTLADPASGRRVQVWADAATRHLQVYTGETLPDPSRRRRGLAVEPMSCPPNALATGADVVHLEPGAHHELVWGIHTR